MTLAHWYVKHTRQYGIGYFRILGIGLHWTDTRRHDLLWSERERIYVQWRIGPWLLTPLPPGNRGIRRRKATP